jgi:hypothetical protein
MQRVATTSIRSVSNPCFNSEFFKISQLPKHISTSNIQWPNALSQPITKNQLSYHAVQEQ